MSTRPTAAELNRHAQALEEALLDNWRSRLPGGAACHAEMTAGWICGATGHTPMPVRSPDRPADALADQNHDEDTSEVFDAPTDPWDDLASMFRPLPGDAERLWPAPEAPTPRPAQSWPPPDPADLAADLDAEGNVRRDWLERPIDRLRGSAPNPLGSDGPDDGGAQ